MHRQYRVQRAEPNQGLAGTTRERRRWSGRLRRDLQRAAQIGLGGHARLGVFGVPLWTGAAHVVPFGMVAVEELAGHSEPNFSDGPADGWVFSVLGHDTFPISRRVPSGSAFWSRRMSAWFRDMMRPNWLKFVTTFPSFAAHFGSSFPKFYRHRRHIHACGKLRCDRRHVSDEDAARADVSIREDARYIILARAIQCSERREPRGYSTFAPDSLTTLPHFSICAAMCWAKCSRVPPTGLTP